jgi:hypothetical protein
MTKPPNKQSEQNSEFLNIKAGGGHSKLQILKDNNSDNDYYYYYS